MEKVSKQMLRKVDREGIEPSSKQGTNMLSTRLSSL